VSLAVTPLHPLFVANLTGVDLVRPINDAMREAIEDAMDAYAVCVLPGQHLGGGQERFRDGKAERLRGREVDEDSNLVGCKTGRSAGPLLSVQTPKNRKLISVMTYQISFFEV
jgi:hypothetical protein